MNFNFLTPVSDSVLAHNALLDDKTLGKKIKIHSAQQGLPNIDGVSIAIIGVLENRNDINYIGEKVNLTEIRKAFYKLYFGNWKSTIVDLGNIQPGETVEDTFFALQTTLSILIEKKIIPIIIGGSQDLTYANYRAYDNLIPMVNLVNVDAQFNLGDSTKPIKNNSFVGKIILDQPYNLFNYAVLGYQTYFNSQEEIDLMENLYFEAYRLGDISENTKLIEPVVRDANIVSVDLTCLSAATVSAKQQFSPNGLSGKEICAVARYAGISNKVSSFGIYEYKPSKDDEMTGLMVAQIIWYFIEGFNARVKDENFLNENNFKKYITLVEGQELIFYKSIKSNRWWIEIPFFETVNNKLKKHTLLPCMHQDYLEACSNKIPERWYKATQKNGVL